MKVLDVINLHRKYGRTFVNNVRNEYNRAKQLRETAGVTFTPDPHTGENPGYAYFSELGYCPLKAALKRAEAEPKFPELKVENDHWLMNRFDIANRVASSMQEAFVWKYGDLAAVEKRVVNHELQATGRADLLFSSEDGLMVYEIKHRADPKPHLQDCYQAMGYAITLGAVMSHIIIIGDNGWPVNVWSLLESGQGFILTDEEGNVYAEDWNTPERINHAEVRRFVVLSSRYIQGEREVPIKDPLNNGSGWLCIRSIPGKYPSKKLGTPGLKRCACEYGCHSESLEPKPYWLLSDGSYSWSDPRNPF